MILKIHILSYYLGVIAFLLATIMGMMMLLQDYSIKSKKLANFSAHLPPLETTDRWVYRLILMGFPCMSLGLLLGFMLAHKEWQGNWTVDPIVIFALLCWCWYACILSTRMLLGWRGRKLALLNMAGFSVVMILMAIKLSFVDTAH